VVRLMSEVDMKHYSAAAVERTMKIQEVILRALAKKINWWQAAEILGISDRQMRRWHRRYEAYGYEGLYDRRRGKPSPRRQTRPHSRSCRKDGFGLPRTKSWKS
jgi:transposase